jgi:hypothetical protein
MATGWTGLWNNEGDATYALLVGAESGAEAPNSEVISKFLRKGRNGNRRLNALIKSLNGTAVGGATASASYARVSGSKGSDGNFGGVRATETRTLINRVSATADKNFIDDLCDRDSQPNTYPADVSGNGGGGKLRF